LGAVWKIMDFWNIAHETRRLQSFDFKYTLGKSVFYYETRALMLGEDEALYIIRDVTTRKAAEEKVSDLLTQARSDNEELRRLGKVKDDFLSALSNELRNPMTTVLGYLRLLKDNSLGPLTPAQAESLSVALQNGIRLRDLLNKLLTSPIQARQTPPDQDTLGLNYLVGNAIENVRLEAEKKGLQIQRFQPPGPSRSSSTRNRWSVSSPTSWRTPSGSRREGDLEIGWGNPKRQGGDGGPFSGSGTTAPGPFRDLERISSLSRCPKPRDQVAGGSGASLALCRQITQAHGGRVWAESVEGQGATFRVLLPLQGLEGPP
jgi:signal transduction histidine kinase